MPEYVPVLILMVLAFGFTILVTLITFVFGPKLPSPEKLAPYESGIRDIEPHDSVERYRGLITASGGQVHRFEDWGRRQLAFPIAKVHKAHYVLMNIECDGKTLDELTGGFRFSDAVLRHLVVKMDSAVTEPSPMARASEEKERGDRDDAGDSASAA